MSGIRSIGLGDSLTTSIDSWDPDFDSFYCDIQETKSRTTEQNERKDSNNELALLSHIVKEIDNANKKSSNKQRLCTEEVPAVSQNKEPEFSEELSDIQSIGLIMKDDSTPTDSNNNIKKSGKKTKKVSFILPTDHAITSELDLEYEPIIYQEKKSELMSENNSKLKDSSKETCSNRNDLGVKLVEEKMNNKNYKCSCCSRDSSNIFKVPELTEILRSLQLECCPNCKTDKQISRKNIKRNSIDTKSNNVFYKQNLLNTDETITSAKVKKKNKTKCSADKKNKTINSISSETKKSRVGEKESESRVNKNGNIDTYESEDYKCISSDHHLKNSNNPKLLGWLKEKNKDFKKKRLEERKRKREERKVQKRNEEELIEKRIVSDNKVNEWMRLKRKEFRLAMRAKSKVAPGNDINVIKNSEHIRKIPDGYLEVKTFLPTKHRTELGESVLKNKQEELKNKKSSKSKVVSVKRREKQKKCETLNESLNESQPDRKRTSYTEWLIRKRNENANKIHIKKKKDSDDQMEENLLASERRRRFKEIQDSKTRVESGLKKLKPSANQNLEEIQVDAGSIIHSRMSNKYKFKSKKGIENELKLRPEPQGCDSSSCMNHIVEDDSNVIKKEINVKNDPRELNKITNIKTISHRPTTSLEYINADFLRPWMVDDVKSCDDGPIREE